MRFAACPRWVLLDASFMIRRNSCAEADERERGRDIEKERERDSQRCALSNGLLKATGVATSSN